MSNSSKLPTDPKDFEDAQESKKDLKRGNPHRIVMWILIIVALLVGVGFLTITPYMVNGSEKEVTVRIPKNATMENVSDTLHKYFPEDYSNKVLRLLDITGFDPVERHGLYVLPVGATPFATMRKIARGSQTPVRITFNGFRSLDTLIERIALKMEFTPDQLKAALNNPELMAKYGLTPDQALALFLEDTYEIYWTASPEELIQKIGDNYNGFWSEGKKALAEDMDLKPSDVMIIASIVDEESNQALEKGRIGRLYINRLDKNMKLQADPTVRFALNDFTINRVTNEHLKVNSPYNTYLHEGLPPGPIRTTSRETVNAILNSKPSSDIFMCAREDFSGFHNFAPTYEEHLENAKRYQNELDRRGIK